MGQGFPGLFAYREYPASGRLLRQIRPNLTKCIQAGQRSTAFLNEGKPAGEQAIYTLGGPGLCWVQSRGVKVK
ncbi:hypothetical protein CPT76_27800 [Paenibacillus sp. AR247]|nr:hypothetical protein CPT76_27800 [Paenibacillus sp. AR247]